MNRPLRHITAIFAVFFFFTPLLLLAGGVRATQFENRALADRPDPRSGWSFFDDATRYLVDHLPLRERAVRFNTWKSLNVFRTTPKYGRAVNAMAEDEALPFAGGAPAGQGHGAEGQPAVKAPETANQVLPGQDDWLFLQGDIDRACYPFMEWDAAVAQWERLARIVRQSGRTVALVIAPDKSTIYPELLPRALPTEACTKAGRKKLWRRLEASKEPSLIALRRELLDLKAADEEDVYHETDSHWNSLGASTLARAVVPAVGGRRILDQDIVAGDEVEHTGDLGGLLGAPRAEPDVPVKVLRPASAPRIRGSVAFVHDSFGMQSVDTLVAESTELTTAIWANDTPDVIIRTIADADVVILETVEREVTYRASAVITDDFLRQLESALRS